MYKRQHAHTLTPHHTRARDRTQVEMHLNLTSITKPQVKCVRIDNIKLDYTDVKVCVLPCFRLFAPFFLVCCVRPYSAFIIAVLCRSPTFPSRDCFVLHARNTHMKRAAARSPPHTYTYTHTHNTSLLTHACKHIPTAQSRGPTHTLPLITFARTPHTPR